MLGHSYGGAVISNAATGADNVQALVYAAGFAPAEGETLTQLTDPERFPGSQLGAALRFRPWSGGVDVSVDPAQFRSVFAADLPARDAAVLAATQRPIEGAIWEEEAGEPAWETIPSWYAVYTRDNALSTVSQEPRRRPHRPHRRLARRFHLGGGPDGGPHPPRRPRDQLNPSYPHSRTTKERTT